MGIVRFGNDHFAAIRGYDNYVHGNFATEKSKKATLPPKLVPNTHFKLELIHMDLCGLMRVESINGKKYILVIVDDYSRYTTNNGTEFKNAALQVHYEKLDKPLQQSTEFTSIPSKEDLDNLFRRIYEEYFKKSSLEVSINSAAQTNLYNNETPSSSSIIVEDNEAVRNYVFLISLDLSRLATTLNRIYSMAGADDENPPPPLVVTPTQQAPHTVSTIKLPILKKGEYDIWAIKMEHYLDHIDYPIWEVIQRGNGPVSVSIDTNGQIKVLPPKTAKEILARERERKARTTLLMAILEDHLAKFHKMIDAKEMREAIKSRFGLSPSKDATSEVTQVFTFFFGPSSTGSSFSAQNVVFIYSESTSSTNDVSTAYGATTSSGYNSQRENSSSYTDELMHSFFANQSSGPKLDHEDLE
ncbi:ribonuclease H-like domain-containing protein [Tanacetum coccineum]